VLLRIILTLTRAIVVALLSLGDGDREHGDRNRSKNGSFEHR
jgi:hypothetical protein